MSVFDNELVDTAMKSTDACPNLRSPDDDPYLWLEEIEGDNALRWVERQNKSTLDRFENTAVQRDRDLLLDIYDNTDNIPYITRRGTHVYNYWRDAENPRGIWRRTTLEDYRNPQPDWDVLFDLDRYAEQEDEDWSWTGASALPGSNDRAVLGFSRGGSDAVVLLEFDLIAKSFMKDGFVLPEARGGFVWLDRDTVLLSSAYGNGMSTQSGFARTIRLWRRGADVDQAPVLFETDPENVGVQAKVIRTSGREEIWYGEWRSTLDTRWWIGDRSGPKTKIDLPHDALINAECDRLVVRLRSDWALGATTYVADTLLVIDKSDFLDGDRQFHVLFEPGEKRALQSFSWCGPILVLSILDNLTPEIEYWKPSGDHWMRTVQSGLPRTGAVISWRLDRNIEESNGEILASIQDPITPPKQCLLTAGSPPAVLKQAPASFDPSGIAVSRHEVESVDGEMIPYWQVGPGTLTGNAPVHLMGYGGFGKSQRPNYNPDIGKLWLERGGTNVVANIRGGGEFGARWHNAGRREGKRLSHDDFAAVAADLVRRGVTRPKRIAAEGGSNGGYLIANMLTRYPERFGALFCTVPLIDMRRFTKLLIGAGFIAEYGNPDLPEDWNYLQHLSAYHTAIPGQDYPPIFLATTRRDDRVHPGHARKMAAKLQAMGYEAHFYESSSGGHSAARDHRQRARLISIGYRFMRESIGWLEDGEA